VLEFGCGEGIVALGVAERLAPLRMVGVEISDATAQCLPIAKRYIGIERLPANLAFQRIEPGQDLRRLGAFDLVYSWSVFEHVSQDILRQTMESVACALAPDGIFFLQISPLYYSAFGSHLNPWVPAPWAHLSMQDDLFKSAFFAASEASDEIIESWSVYDSSSDGFRDRVWRTYRTLNKVTARELEREARGAGLEIVRDYRTHCDPPVPDHLAAIFDADTLRTEQVVWLLRRA
jgi:cyclopropane fatty-acyl-phospholipid synthase-like methyltransferase